MVRPFLAVAEVILENCIALLATKCRRDALNYYRN